MLSFVSAYSKQYDQINEDIIYGIRKRDNMVTYIDELGVEIAKAIPNFVEYLGFVYDDSNKSFRDISKGKEYLFKTYGTKAEEQPTVNVNYSYSRLAIFKFKIKYEGEITIVKMPIFIPLLIDGFHFYIRGNKYAAPFQLVDAITYIGKNNSVVLKTMTRSLKLSREKVNITDTHGTQYQVYAFYTHINIKRVPMLLYYFSYYGFLKTMKYFGCEKYIKLYNDFPKEKDPSWIFFKFGKIFIAVMRDKFEQNYLLRQYIATTMQLSRKSLDQDLIGQPSYWKQILGSTLTDKKPIEKGINLLFTYTTALDYRTAMNIDKLIGGSRRTTTFAVMRWMFIKFNQLCIKNNSLVNKKLRLGEYLITPLIREVYAKLYRFMNTPKNMLDKKRVMDIFKISPAVILNAIIGKTKNKKMALNIAKYSSYVNDLSILNVALKYTVSGPGTPIEKSGKMAGNYFRQFDPTFIGKICVTTTSNGDPGISGVISPFSSVNKETLTFKDD